MFIAILLSISILLGGGASIASESSLPGEFLYSVKTNINEPIKQALTFGAKADAELDIQLIQERLNEKNQLEANGKLTASINSDIERLISNHYYEYINEKESMIKSDDTTTINNLDIKMSSLLESSGINITTINNSKVNSKNTDNSVQENIDIKIDSISNAGSSMGDIIDTTIDGMSENIEAGAEATSDTMIDLGNSMKDKSIEVFGVMNSSTEMETKSGTDIESQTDINTQSEVNNDSNISTSSDINIKSK